MLQNTSYRAPCLSLKPVSYMHVPQVNYFYKKQKKKHIFAYQKSSIRILSHLKLF